MLSKRNLNKRHRFDPITVGLIVGGVIVCATWTTVLLTTAIVLLAVKLASRPDITIPVIYPDE